MTVLLMAEVAGGTLGADSTAKALTAAKPLGEVHLLVDPRKAPSVVRDFENVVVLQGSAGEIDKKSDPSITHWTDALGYYIEARYPLHEHKLTVEPL